MANVNAAATVWNCPNYMGEIFQIGANQTPFLNMIGGLSGGRIKTVSAFQFNMAQPWALEAASQPAVTETQSITAPTAWTYVREADVNTCQIFHTQVAVSYAKQSVIGQLDEIGTDGFVTIDGTQPVTNDKDWQIAAHLKQLSTNIEYCYLNGAYQQASGVDTAAKIKGIITGATTNTVAAGSVDLSKALLDELLRTMAANGAVFENTVCFVNAMQKQRISDIYGFAPQSRNVGGYDINVVETDFAQLGVVWAPRMPTSTLLIADLSVCKPVFLPVPGKGALFYEELSKVGASEKGQLYGQIGLDYGPEEYHGTITGLTTS